MSFLVGEIATYLLIASLLGVLVGWFLYRCNCKKTTEELNSKITNINSELDNTKSELNTTVSELNTTTQLLSTANQDKRSLKGELALSQGNAKLMESRWRSTLKTAKQLPNHQRWVNSLQQQLASTKTTLQQNRGYAEAMAAKASSTAENLSRAHSRLSEMDNQISNLKDWVHVFQTKLKATKTEYAQLRSFATEVDTKRKATQENLQRVHTRLSEVDGKQQPLRTWIRVFQTKLKKRRTEYEQLRSYASNVQSKLNATDDNLGRVHTRLTRVSHELYNVKNGIDTSMPAIPPEAPVSDNKALRMFDKIRLLGSSKDSVYGRMNNQLREVRLDAVHKERVLTDSCEEKDAIINDLRQQLRKAENRAQTAPHENIDQSVKIKELEAQLARTKTEIQTPNDLEDQLREHRLTIAAYREKLSSSETPIEKEVNEPAAPISQATNGEADDLKIIKGIGPKLEGILHDLGITTFAQIAAWNNDDIENISSKLGSFKDRITRDDWVTKAREIEAAKQN